MQLHLKMYSMFNIQFGRDDAFKAELWANSFNSSIQMVLSAKGFVISLSHFCNIYIATTQNSQDSDIILLGPCHSNNPVTRGKPTK